MLGVLASLVLLAAPLDSRPSVAIFTLAHEQGVTPSMAKLMTDRMAQLVRDSGAFSSVITSSELESLLSAEIQRQAMNCDATSCMKEVGEALNVTLILSGNVGRVGNSFLLNARLVSVRDAVARASVGERYRMASEDELLDHIEEAVWLLLERSGLPHTLRSPHGSNESHLAVVLPVETPPAPPDPKVDTPAVQPPVERRVIIVPLPRPDPAPPVVPPRVEPPEETSVMATPAPLSNIPDDVAEQEASPLRPALFGAAGVAGAAGVVGGVVAAVVAYLVVGTVVLVQQGGPNGAGQRGLVADVAGAASGAMMMGLVGGPLLLLGGALVLTAWVVP